MSKCAVSCPPPPRAATAGTGSSIVCVAVQAARPRAAATGCPVHGGPTRPSWRWPVVVVRALEIPGRATAGATRRRTFFGGAGRLEERRASGGCRRMRMSMPARVAHTALRPALTSPAPADLPAPLCVADGSAPRSVTDALRRPTRHATTSCSTRGLHPTWGKLGVCADGGAAAAQSSCRQGCGVVGLV